MNKNLLRFENYFFHAFVYFAIFISGSFITLGQKEINENDLPDYIVTRLNFKLLDWTKIDNPELLEFSLTEILNDAGKKELEKIHWDGVDFGKVKLTKIFDNYFTKDSISISRTGEKVYIPPFWATFKLKIPNDIYYWKFYSELRKMYPLIIFIDPPIELEYTDLPNDEHFNSQTSLYNFGSPESAINMNEAWEIETGKRFVKVGVYDTGIDQFHEDLNDVYLAGMHYYSPSTSVAPHANLGGLDYLGHGTPVAGIIGSKRNNGIGVAGIAGGDGTDSTGVSLVSFALSDDHSDAGIEMFSKAIIDGARSVGTYHDWSMNLPNSQEPTNWKHTTGYGINIGNQSVNFYVKIPSIHDGKTIYNGGEDFIDWGLEDDNFQCLLCREAYLFSLKNGVTTVLARGNHAGTETSLNPLTAPLSSQSKYLDDSWVITVGASGTDGNRLNSIVNGSPTISHWQSPIGYNLDVIAPGSVVNLVSTRSSQENPSIPDKYRTFGGTSGATPHVSGVAALLMSKYNKNCYSLLNLDPADIEYIIQESATHVASNPGYDDSTGYGRLNAQAALEMIDFPTLQILHPPFPPVNFQISAIDTISLNLNRPLNQTELGPLGSSFSLQLQRDYKVVRYEANFTYDFSLLMSPSSELLDVWIRHSQTNTLRKMNDTIWGMIQTTPTSPPFFGPIPDTFAIEPMADIVNIVGNTVQFKGYYYQFQDKYYNDIQTGIFDTTNINFWYPINPYIEVPQVAYSIYVRDTLASIRYDFPCDSTNLPFDIHLGVNNLKTNDLTIFPNPSNNDITIKLSENENGGVLQILDTKGKIVHEEKIETGTREWKRNLESFQCGIYYIQFKDKKEGSIIKKWVKI